MYFDWDILVDVTVPLPLTVWYVQYSSMSSSEGVHLKEMFCPLRAVMLSLGELMDSAVNVKKTKIL